MLCVNIGDDKIKIIDGKKSGGTIVVNKCYEIETKVGAMESGNIKDLMAFSQVLQECINAGAIKTTALIYVLDNPRVRSYPRLSPNCCRGARRLSSDPSLPPGTSIT